MDRPKAETDEGAFAPPPSPPPNPLLATRYSLLATRYSLPTTRYSILPHPPKSASAEFLYRGSDVTSSPTQAGSKTCVSMLGNSTSASTRPSCRPENTSISHVSLPCATLLQA